ncbi:PGPGW domain-containing protein [Cellulomonas sp. GbtcB1]|jgi:uncharacterized protein (TIGR02611 family)|uniref:PGPGW domain-containing protein n=1 Tax=Cellulomonas sp. GbtcB1 TaxID=2824746 RepID=UPI001C30EA31|nr:PGPGW domain-containing protein [Cellulomonas sp. GbtcB1]
MTTPTPAGAGPAGPAPTEGLAAEIAAGERTDTGAHRALARLRARLDSRPWLRLTYKVVVTVVGATVVLAGIAMLVLPGPGWLAIFLGLGILGTEFAVIQRFNHRLKALVLRYWHAFRERRARRAAQRRAAAAAAAARRGAPAA